METEFIPLDALKRVLRLWWVVAAAVIIGGAVGFVFHRLHPPLYESTATYHVNLNFNQADQFVKPGDIKASQYNEDMALSAVKAALVEVEPAVIADANQANITLSDDTFGANNNIARLQAFWEISFRSRDPKIAQKVVALWTDEATKAMYVYQQDGRMKTYVYFELINKASLPARPTYYGTNQMVLAGGLVGLVIGILLASLPFSRRQGAAQPRGE
jgi:uncharacterized protein involved in exopolysaccharide biosynthesis